MNVLVIAPHPDDEAIGCGGAVLGHAAGGDTVQVLFLTSGELGLPQLDAEQARTVREGEAVAAADVLGVTDLTFVRLPDWHLDERGDDALGAVAGAMARRKPEVVYTPHADEWHPDHRAAHAVTLGAAAEAGVSRAAVLTYEVWTPMTHFDEVDDISDRMARKLQAVRCHRSQLGEFDYVQAVTGLGQYRGALAARSAYAEVFARCA